MKLGKLLMTSCFEFVFFYHVVLICYYWRGTRLYFTHLFFDVNFISFKQFSHYHVSYWD